MVDGSTDAAATGESSLRHSPMCCDTLVCCGAGYRLLDKCSRLCDSETAVLP